MYMSKTFQKESLGEKYNSDALAAITSMMASAFIAVLLFVPLSPGMPSVGLDPSWAYAVNEAVAQHKTFGKDFIFTFGPLGFLYTSLYHPAIDTAMLVGRTFIAVSLCVGYALVLWNRVFFFWIALPLVVFMAVHSFIDATFMILPVLLFLSVFRVCEPPDSAYHLPTNGMIVSALVILTAAVAILPLVKGSLTATVAVCGAFSLTICLLARRPRFASAFLAMGVLTPCLAWVAAGQPLSAILDYFSNQSQIVQGYSEAMSSTPKIPRAIFQVATALAIMALQLSIAYRAVSSKRTRILLTLVIAVSMFVALKSGFVRQDGHVAITYWFLFLSGIAMSVFIKDSKPFILWNTLCGLYGVFVLFGLISGMDPKSAFDLMRNDYNKIANGISLRLDPGALAKQFDQANSLIRQKVPLPLVHGSSDIYPVDLSAIFAWGLKWNGRPIP
jgi:hypothetical protein